MTPIDGLYAAIIRASDEGRTIPCRAMSDHPGWISDKDNEQKDAAKLCFNCPVFADCWGYVTQNPEPAGVWAGLTELERTTPQQRQRRRKNNDTET